MKGVAKHRIFISGKPGNLVNPVGIPRLSINNKTSSDIIGSHKQKKDHHDPTTRYDSSPPQGLFLRQSYYEPSARFPIDWHDAPFRKKYNVLITK